MAGNLQRVNEYKKVQGVLRATGGGIRLIENTVIRAMWAGYGYDGYDQHNVFALTCKNGRTVYTDWAGVDSLNTLVRVNEYKITNGVIRSTGHGIRLNTQNISYLIYAGTGYDGDDDHNVFTIYYNDGKTAITDWAGVSLIDNFGMS